MDFKRRGGKKKEIRKKRKKIHRLFHTAAVATQPQTNQPIHPQAIVSRKQKRKPWLNRNNT
jgi:hypothetical protein